MPEWKPIGTKFRRRLTDAEMAAIRETTKASGSVAGFNALWSILLDMPWDEAVESGAQAEVRDYAIPDDQDREIQRALSVSPSRANRKRWSQRTTGMQFLFYGPANYTEEEEKEEEEEDE